jgi:hypothetical protein
MMKKKTGWAIVLGALLFARSTVSAAPPSPVITFGTPSPSISTSTAVGTTLSTIAITMTDGSTFNGVLGFGGTFGDGGGDCAISGTNLVLGRTVSLGTFNCTLTASQVTTSPPVDVSINIATPGAPVPTAITVTPQTVRTPDNSLAGNALASAIVTMSDGSTFLGTLTTNNPGLVAFSGLTIILARDLTPGDDGYHNISIGAQ